MAHELVKKFAQLREAASLIPSSVVTLLLYVPLICQARLSLLLGHFFLLL